MTINTQYKRNVTELADICSVRAGREISPCFVRYLVFTAEHSAVGRDGQFAVSRLACWPA